MSTETLIIDGDDYTATDAEARAIIGYLARYRGVTEENVARTPYRVLVNMILKAHLEIEAARSEVDSCRDAGVTKPSRPQLSQRRITSQKWR